MRIVAAHHVPVVAPMMRPVGEEADVAERAERHGPAIGLQGGGPGLRPVGGMVLGLNRTGSGDG